ncbi:unnamed protein product [Ambrosiozyma monospora]|uniref:Unnamed protein product n=1 Tax=Ambrosiozyma monospora TaxID=43982 RepID=A0ACB5T819_AMBMO|nr:unnamed protein product [Ambrosiozyma monospora]
MDAQVSTFMEITSVEDPQVASNFLEMSGGDIDTAVSLFFEHGADLGATTGTGSGSGNNHNNDITSHNDVMDTDNDAAMAERLQNEMYQQQQHQQQDEVRRPIEPMHDQLVDFGMGMGGMGMGMGMPGMPGMGMGGERGI